MNALAGEIQRLVANVPGLTIAQLAEILLQWQDKSLSELQSRLVAVAAQPGLAQRLHRLVDIWQQDAPLLRPDAVALALVAAGQTEAYHQGRQRLELVWTGPDSPAIALRRTEQALLEVIDSAESELHIVSFAVYKAARIVEALLRAVQRGVQLSLYLETPDSSQGRIAFGPLGALGLELVERSHLYVWPVDKRTHSADGSLGALHAKLAVADARRLFISSANLTGHAMLFNMEMGVLITGGAAPQQAQRHLADLVERRVFQLMD